MSIGKLYGQSANPRVLRSVAAAKVNGLDVEVVETAPVADTHKPEFLAKFPTGKVPAFEGPDGFLLSESRAIVEYSTLKKNAGQVGYRMRKFQLSLT